MNTRDMGLQKKNFLLFGSIYRLNINVTFNCVNKLQGMAFGEFQLIVTTICSIDSLKPTFASYNC